jgi:hypothetical protein
MLRNVASPKTPLVAWRTQNLADLPCVITRKPPDAHRKGVMIASETTELASMSSHSSSLSAVIDFLIDTKYVDVMSPETTP